MGYFIKKQNRKNITRFFTFLSLCFLLSGTAPLTALAHDAEWGMWRGEQNALIIGTITETEGNLYQITVNHALTCGPEGAEKNVIDRMLPLSEIPGELTADFTGYQGELYSYTTSYHGREKLEKGDFVLLSLDKKGEIWKLVWPPYELSGTDPQTLELLPEKRRPTRLLPGRYSSVPAAVSTTSFFPAQTAFRQIFCRRTAPSKGNCCGSGRKERSLKRLIRVRPAGTYQMKQPP